MATSTLAIVLVQEEARIFQKPPQDAQVHVNCLHVWCTGVQSMHTYPAKGIVLVERKGTDHFRWSAQLEGSNLQILSILTQSETVTAETNTDF